MMDFEMDCTNTDDGDWFEVKGWLEFAGGYTGWELDIHQGVCGGQVGGIAPSTSTNHKARCVDPATKTSVVVEDVYFFTVKELARGKKKSKL